MTHQNNETKNELCHNCGSFGHICNECKLAIISIGVILYRLNDNNEYEYLMIRRKESFGLSDFTFGKHNNYNPVILQNIINEMTINEKSIITKIINNEELDIVVPEQLKKKINNFNINKDNYNITNLIENSNTTWTEPEWGFPKGRRNYSEKELDCALREFEEETGISKKDIELIENIIPFEEIFIGSNYKTYKHKYFLAQAKNIDYDLSNFQQSEVSKVEWKTYETCLKEIRPYNIEKKNLLERIHKCLLLNKII